MSDPKISQRELGKRLAPHLGWTAEDCRRWVRKILSGEVKRPGPESLRALEKSLGRQRGYLTLPDPEPRAARAGREALVERRLAGLEAAVNRLGEILEAELPQLVRRVQALEQRPKTKRPPKAQGSTQ